MRTPLVLTATACVALWTTLSGRAPESALDTAALAWDRGDYVTALNTYLQVLASPEADAALETIALQTGELYVTTELTTDGLVPRFSPDGRYLLYETGPADSRVTRVLAADGSTRAIAELRGNGAAFSPDGSRIVYVKSTAAPNGPALAVYDVASGHETVLDTGTLRKSAPAFAAGGSIVFAASTAEAPAAQIYSASETSPPAALTTGETEKVPLEMNATGTALLFSIRTAAAGRGAGPGGRAAGSGAGTGRGGSPAAAASFGLLSIADGRSTTIAGSAPSFSGDGRTFAYVAREGDENRIVTAPSNDPARSTIVRKGPERIDAPVLSRDGSRVAFQMMSKEDWEIYVAGRDGTGETRVTREIQHDILPRFVTSDRLLATMGEPRHRRSYLYDLTSLKRTRLFHNNTIRTIAPEYSWVISADGTRILIGAERDGNTISPERGIYLVDLSRRVTRDALRQRLKANLDAEQALRAKGKRLFAPIAASVSQVVSGASVARIFGYEKALFDFDSKHITQPGNRKAAAFLFETYKSFGYEPEYQSFEARGVQTANVIATLKGTVNPELIYVVSSHYDSVVAGPGADDDSSGTAALLETARLLASRPQPATIVFASFTGEEGGLLGSREFVRRAVADKLKVVGALNNDMIGWANDHRLDNTIRYSNAGIRDIQHGAAMQFSNLITYDALYYRGTDAAAYYEAYGDIVGGIGSYPVLGNPHYHQAHDLLDTINHQLVTEVARTTVATLMLLASSPSRLKDLKVESPKPGTATLTWTPSPETGVTGYIVAYGPASNPEAQQIRVVKPAATLTGVAPGTVVAVKAVNARGLEGWDWARTSVK
jgi:Tol biopolymer transport system component